MIIGDEVKLENKFNKPVIALSNKINSKNISKKFAQPNDCVYICNRTIAY